MLEYVSRGEVFDGLDPVCPPGVTTGGQRPSIRASVLSGLLTGDERTVTRKGVRLRRLRISGLLDLDAAAVRCPLVLDDCELDGSHPVALNFATIPYLELTRCQLAGLSADSATFLGNLNLAGSMVSGTVVTTGARIGGALIFLGSGIGADGNGNSVFCHGMSVRLSVHFGKGFVSAGAVVMPRVDIGGELIFREARLGANTSGESLSAAGLKVGGAAYFRGAAAPDGAVILTGASIGGRLLFDAAEVGADADGNSVLCDGIRAGGTISFDRDHSGRSFTSAGAIRLAGAQVAGSLTCRGGRVGANRYGNALVADELKADVAVLLESGFTASGAIRLPGAVISGQVRCDGKISGTDNDGYSLVADRARIGGPASLVGAFESAGAVAIPGADIGGSLSLAGATLGRSDPSGDSLIADAMKTGGSVHLDDQFTSTGTVRLAHARISGSLHCASAGLGPGVEHGSLAGEQVHVGGSVFFDDGFTAAGPLSLSGAVIAHELRWEPARRPAGGVDLQGARCQYLGDDWTGQRSGGYWPATGLQLAGFNYGGFSGARQAGAEERLAWLRSQHNSGARFSTQPYRQLADVYRQAGQTGEAIIVEIAMRRDLRKYGTLTWQHRTLNWVLDQSIRYGYQTGRALAGLAILFLAVLAAAIAAQHQAGLIMAAANSNPSLHPTALRCVTGYPCFYPAGFAIDIVVPVINVHQADHWQINGHHLLGWIWVAGSWAATALGWFMATLLVVGYTGLAKHE